MDNIARPILDGEPGSDFGTALVRTIYADSSLGVTAQLHDFLGSRDSAPDLRSPMKALRPALVADIAHFMYISHGRHPGVIDHAAQKMPEDAARRWLLDAGDAMLAERHYLNMLTVAAGPIRRQMGQDKITSALAQQTRNFEMLASSDRRGCPVGAAVAFAIDWTLTRPLLDRLALHLGLEALPCTFPDARAGAALLNALSDGPTFERAAAFGAQQYLGQQRGLWQLIAARHVELLAG